MNHKRHAPFRAPSDGRRLRAMGFYLAEQTLTSDARDRSERDPEFRRDLEAASEFMRPHVFAGRAARDAACRSPMRGGVYALEPISADGVRSRRYGTCLFAIGHGVDDVDFSDVALAIADPEMVSLV